MSILAHDVQAKQAERDRLAAEVAAWVARNGQPPCYGPEVSLINQGRDLSNTAQLKRESAAARLAAQSAAKRRKGKQ